MEIMDDNPLIIYVKEKELDKTYKHVLLQKPVLQYARRPTRYR